MEVLAVPRIVISGTRSAVGKSLLTIGLALELRRRSISVACAVLGLDLCQSIILKRVCGRYVRTLDQRLLSRDQILSSLFLAGIGAELVIIDGEGGLYDGTPAGGFYRGSDSEFAALTRTPVCLIVDARGFGASMGALLKGYVSTASGFEVVSAIANRMSRDERAYNKANDSYIEGIAACNMPKLLGAVPELANPYDLSRKQINQMKNDTLLPRQFFVDVAEAVRDHVDVERLVTLAQRAQGVRLDNFSHQPLNRRCRIAVSEDSSFNLCMQDNLELLRYYGAEIVPFSPLADIQLPQRVGAVYLTGGYIPEYVEQLNSNSSMRKALLEFVDQGGALYSEGSGTAFLCREFTIPGREERFEGLGLIPAVVGPGSGQWSFCEGVTTEESILGRQGLVVKSVSSGDWKIVKEESCVKTMRIAEKGGKSWQEGYSPRAQISATFNFQHWGSNPEIAKNFVEAATVVHNIGAS